MISTLNTLALSAVILALTGCAQTSLLKPVSGNDTSATVENPILFSRARLTVMLEGKTYTGVAGETREETTGEIPLQFGWDPEHIYPHLKQDTPRSQLSKHHPRKHRHEKETLSFWFGSTILTANDGATLTCDHLKHENDWRLRCKRPSGEEIVLQPVKK